MLSLLRMVVFGLNVIPYGDRLWLDLTSSFFDTIPKSITSYFYFIILIDLSSFGRSYGSNSAAFETGRGFNILLHIIIPWSTTAYLLFPGLSSIFVGSIILATSVVYTESYLSLLLRSLTLFSNLITYFQFAFLSYRT